MGSPGTFTQPIYTPLPTPLKKKQDFIPKTFLILTRKKKFFRTKTCLDPLENTSHLAQLKNISAHKIFILTKKSIFQNKKFFLLTGKNN